MEDILKNIVIYKKKEIAQSKTSTSVSQLEKTINFDRSCNSYSGVLQDPDSSGVIAEFKRKSPSKSDINLDADLAVVTRAYVDGGASAISILTDHHFFGGENDFLKQTRTQHPDIPLLRKEFIIDEYQIIEAKALGADIILLICEILTKEQVLQFSRLARSLGMEVLLELHSEDQIRKCNDEVSYIGVNNRDLKTFTVDYERSKKLFDQLPSAIPKIAESGLSKVSSCTMLYEYGFRGFLIGEQFMKQSDPGKACHIFIDEFLRNRAQR